MNLALGKQEGLLLEKGEMLPIMEEFYTIQGEGFHTGRAAYFVRVGGCDVGCHWCDVKESWNAELHPLKPVKSTVAEALKNDSKVVVVTGGEPTAYNLQCLTQELKDKGVATHLETSGAYGITGEWDWICLSPKKNMKPLEENCKLANELKVIVYNNDDLKWAEEYALKVNKDCYLYLQPEWSKREQLMPKIINYVMEHPQWMISIQTHKYLRIP